MVKLDTLRKKMQTRLRKAEKLRATGELTDEEYAAIAVDAVIRLQHPELPTRDNGHLRAFPIRWTDFHMDADAAIFGSDVEWVEADDADQAALGAYSMAPSVLQDATGGKTTVEWRSRGFEWGEREDVILRNALLRLSRMNRGAEAIEEWLDVRGTRFPRVSALLTVAISALFGGLVGFMFGRLSVRLDQPAGVEAPAATAQPTKGVSGAGPTTVTPANINAPTARGRQ